MINVADKFLETDIPIAIQIYLAQDLIKLLTLCSSLIHNDIVDLFFLYFPIAILIEQTKDFSELFFVELPLYLCSKGQELVILNCT
jgi:hypothetical protein